MPKLAQAPQSLCDNCFPQTTSTPKFNALLEKLVAHLYYFIVTRYLSCLKRQLGFSSKNSVNGHRPACCVPIGHFSIALNFLILLRKQVGAQAPQLNMLKA